eukprot:gene27246-32916_t
MWRWVLLLLLMAKYACCQEQLKLLRNNWQNRPLHSPYAKEIHRHLSNCSRKVVYHQFKNYGMGGDLHIWSQAICNAIGQESVLNIIPQQSWAWNDKKFCVGKEIPVLACYFNYANFCPETSGRQEIITHLNELHRCPEYIFDMDSRLAFRAAAMEFLFSNLSFPLVNETEHAALKLFGSKGVPENMITVHIRWGDKSQEMRIVPIATYLLAIKSLLEKHNITTKPQIFLISESSEARAEFLKEVSSSNLPWEVRFHEQPQSSDLSATERWPVRAAFVSEGATGLASLVSLLIALESKFYVLTTGSNWSRLINELRVNVVDVRCNNCTYMVDLQQAHKFHNWR